MLGGFEASVGPSELLRAHQAEGAAILAERLRRWRCAVLADPVGTGKSYTALAVSALVGAVPTVVCPPPLVPQWSELLSSQGVDAELVSDGVLSRRDVSSSADGVVIVDEGHRFRNLTTQRRARLLRLVGYRRVLWLSATPVWNTRRDLLSLVRVTVGSALFQRAIGCTIEFAAERIDDDEGVWQAVCERFVLRRRLDRGVLRRTNQVRARVVPESVSDLVVRAAPGAMVFPGEPRELYRRGVARRLASSAEAALSTLERADGFLARLEEAQQTGCTIGRAEFLLAFGAELGGPTQCVLPFWFKPAELQVDGLGELRHALGVAIGALRGHPFSESEKAGVLRRFVASSAKTLVFTEFRATASAIWNALPAGDTAALITGADAWVRGLGRVSREDALDLFRHGEPRLSLAPRVLVLTPVGAEGLNLQCAEAVVHADLAWNGARMEQREGRADRIGGAAEVSVLTFRPPLELEAHCGVERALKRKAVLASIPPTTVVPPSSESPAQVCSRMSLRLKGGGRLTVGVDELSATVGGSLASSSLLVRRVCSGESYVMVALSKALAPRIRVPAAWLRRIRSLEWAGQDEALVVVLSRLALALGDCGDAGANAAERGELPDVSCGGGHVHTSPSGFV